MTIISRTYGKILAVLMAWFGFSAIFVSCTKYGAPSATYKATGVVVSETDDVPIEGIRAVLKDQLDWEIETVHTNNKGVFNLRSYYGNTLYVELADVDGEKNGLFNDTTVVADFSHVKFKRSIIRAHNEVEKDLGIIRMKPKK